MGLLTRAAVLAVLASCYSPSLRDCTVTCTGPSDCASGQVCGEDGLCAAPATAGRCALAMLDAGPDGASDGAPDAAPDAPATIQLRVEIDGEGSVVVDGHGTCSSRDPGRGKCTYDIAVGVPQRVTALPVRLDQLFVGWTSTTCDDAGPICVFVATAEAPVAVTARFGHGGH